MGPARRLTDSAAQDLFLNVHAVLGTVTVIVDGPINSWKTRVKNGQKFSQRFSSAKKAEGRRSPAFELLMKVRNYAQHQGHVPLFLAQDDYEDGAVVALQARLEFPSAAMKSCPVTVRDCLSVLHHDFALVLKEGYKSLDYLDSLNREFLLEVFAERASIAREAVLLAHHDETDGASFLVSEADERQPVRILTLREQDLLESLAALPASYSIRYPRSSGPGWFVQGPSPASQRPLLSEAPHRPKPGEAPWWALDLPRARTEL